jgi:hypothetical protein
MASKGTRRTNGTNRQTRPHADVFKPDDEPYPTLGQREVVPLRQPSEEDKADFKRIYDQCQNLLHSSACVLLPRRTFRVSNADLLLLFAPQQAPSRPSKSS